MRKQEEREYIIKDYIHLLIRHAGCMIVLIVLMAGVLASLKYMKDKKALANTAVNDNISTSEILENMPLSQKQSILDIISLKEALIDKREYMEHNSMMRVNPYHVPTEILTYVIKDVDEDKLNEIKVAYEDAIFSNEFVEKIEENIGEYDEIMDYISVSFEFVKDDSEMEEVSPAFVVKITGHDEKSTKNIAEVVRTIIKTQKESVEKLTSNHKMTPISDIYTVKVNDVLVEKQTNLGTQIFNLNNQINTLMNSFDEETKTFIKSHLNEYLREMDAANIDSDQNEETPEDTNTVASVSIDKKWIVLGICFGIFIYAAFLGCIWLFNGKIHSYDEFIANYDVKVYGVYGNKSKGNIFYRLADWICNLGKKMKNDDITSKMLLSQMLIDLRKEEKKEIILTGSTLDDASYEKDLKELCQELKDNGIDIRRYNHFLENPDALLDGSIEGNRVVIVEKLKEANFCDVQEELFKCAEYDMNVLGCILIG